MGEVRASNYVYRFKTPEQWKVFMGGLTPSAAGRSVRGFRWKTVRGRVQ